ncbi:MAG: hypothetical protein GXP35_08565 [Actinobacteria bacterium]|nr:hypothetical protein [Actinomycetota bacterium]
MSDRLGVVVRLRRLRERNAQRDLAGLHDRLVSARQHLDSLRRPIFDGGRELGPEHLIALRAQGVLRAEELEMARKELQRSRSAVNEAMTAVQIATGRRKVAESLTEKRRLARAAVAARVAQASLDEAVVMRRAWHAANEAKNE